jgi:hypothetical protein
LSLICSSVSYYNSIQLVENLLVDFSRKCISEIALI